jgi:hypothetical protein
MGNNFAVQAEGFWDGAWINSLGKAGLNKNGSRRLNGCISLENAKQRAIHAVLNRLRSKRFGSITWMDLPIFKERKSELYNRLVSEIVENVEWTYHLPSDSYRTRFDINDVNEMAGVMA